MNTSKRVIRRHQSRALATYKPSAYSRKRALYLKHELRRVEPLLRGLAHRSPLTRLFPILQLLKAVAKVLLLGEVELVMLGVVLQGSRWEVGDPAIESGAVGMGELLCFPSERPEYRQVMLYLLVAGYAAKLSVDPQTEDLLDEVGRLCVDFEGIFQQWAERHSQLLVVSPAGFNLLHKSLSAPANSLALDCHLLVDQIVLLSHAYDSDHSDAPAPSPAPSPHLKPRPSTDCPAAICDWRAQFAGRGWEGAGGVEEAREESMHIFGQRQLTLSERYPGIFDSNLGGVFNMGNIHYSQKQEMEGDYFELGLCEGESDNFVILCPADRTLPSLILGERGYSLLDSQSRNAPPQDPSHLDIA